MSISQPADSARRLLATLTLMMVAAAACAGGERGNNGPGHSLNRRTGSSSTHGSSTNHSPSDNLDTAPPLRPMAASHSVVTERAVSDQSCPPGGTLGRWTTRFGYNRGLFGQFEDGRQSFALRMNLRMQFRGSGFSPRADTWTDNAGVTRDIEGRRGFDTERARLILSGHAFSPDLKFFLQLDGDHDGGHFVDFFDYWWAWQASESWQIQFGKRKVAASRNWLLGAFDTRLADRPFSTDFFRPGRSVGVWLVNDPSDDFHFEIGATDGYRTDNLTPGDTNNELTFSASSWWDVLGEYDASSPVDFENHHDHAVRLGWSWVTSLKGSRGSTLGETDFLRLSDGTRLTQVGALGTLATVEEFDLTFLSLDAGWKYRGWSANAEYFMRWIEDIEADRPISPQELFQYGYYVEAGFFLRPKSFELNAHVAGVNGEFGSTTAVAGGFSWYPRRTRNLKLTIDLTSVDGSPVNSTGSDILVGDDGLLTRIQMQALF